MVVTLDFVCIRLNTETGTPEVMLQKRKTEPEAGRFALIGGWIWEAPTEEGAEYDQDLQGAAHRILRTKTGFLPSYLEQVSCEGSLTRDPSLGWSVTIPYLCLFNRPEMADLESRPDIRWEPIDAILSGHVPLPFDHSLLVGKAVDAFVNKIRYSSLLLYLLPEKVTVSQIEDAYELFGVNVKKQTVFSRWINTGLLVETGELSTPTRGRPSKLYRLTETSLTYFDSEIGKTYKKQAVTAQAIS